MVAMDEELLLMGRAQRAFEKLPPAAREYLIERWSAEINTVTTVEAPPAPEIVNG